MDKRKYVIYALCSFFFLGTICNVQAVEIRNLAINHLNFKDYVFSAVKDSVLPHYYEGKMPIFKPNQNIDYKILEVQIDPGVEYKILKIDTLWNPFNRKNYTPKFPTDSPIPQPPGFQKPLNPFPHDFQRNPKLPKNKREKN